MRLFSQRNAFVSIAKCLCFLLVKFEWHTIVEHGWISLIQLYHKKTMIYEPMCCLI